MDDSIIELENQLSAEDTIDDTNIYSGVNFQREHFRKIKTTKFTDEYLVASSQIDKKEERSKIKRHKLANKIFDHIRENNKEYLTCAENFYYPDESIELSKPHKVIKTEENLEKCTKFQEFDHLELFRPYLNILDEMAIDSSKEPKMKNGLRKIKPGDSKEWMKKIKLDIQERQQDIRNDIHTIRAGWVPSGNQRTWSQFVNSGIYNQEISLPRVITYRGVASSLNSYAAANSDLLQLDPNHWFSLFPTEVPKIHFSDWKNDVIKKTDDIFKPRRPELSIDPYTLIDITIDNEIERIERRHIEINNKHKSRDIVWSAFFNTSSDDYYIPPKRSDVFEDEIYKVTIRHALPALDLQRTLFPTHMDMIHLRRWHRPLMSDFEHGTKLKTGFHPIKNLIKFIDKGFKEYKESTQSVGVSETFSMKSMKDLTAMNGHLILLEYSEEFPLFVNQIGMNSMIRMYYCKNTKSDSFKGICEYGQIADIPPDISPFLGAIHPGETLLSLENNMFRSPLFSHKPKSTDLLVIRNTNGYFIRSVPVIFIVGQEHPKMEVPGPNSKIAMRCARERVQCYIYQLFINSRENPKRIKIASVRKAFKQHSENSIRKRLKTCAEYYRQNTAAGKSNWWILRNDFRLPTFEDMHERLTPELVCSYYSMLAAQRRLKDAGYGKKSLFVSEDEGEDETDPKNIDDEILCAPWHTTRTFLMSQRGKCLMAINGFADPTSCGEGFSFVRYNYRRDDARSVQPQTEGRRNRSIITGTDADLRKLKMNQCRQILCEMGVSPERVDRMQRWDMINMIRRLGSISNKTGNFQDTIGKYARAAKFSTIESLDKYREECQSIFDLQTRCLSSIQEISSDEEEDTVDNSEVNEWTKNLEDILLNKQDDDYVEIDEEEQERLRMLKLIHEDKSLFEEPESANLNQPVSPLPTKLVIHRTFNESTGSFVRSETVVDPRIISAYLRITKNKNYREVYARHDSKTMDELRREKKRVQDQLRRISKVEENEPETKKIEKSNKKEKVKSKTNMRCTACGEFGHMRTNRICSKYYETHPIQPVASPDSKSTPSVGLADKLQSESSHGVDSSVKIEGTKLVVGKALVEAAEELNKQSFKIGEMFGRKRKGSDDEFLYEGNIKTNRLASRRRADPKILISAIFEDILIKLKDLSASVYFLQPVCSKKVPDYVKIVKNPIDLSSMRDYCKNRKYLHRDMFICDMQLLKSNSVLYNGLASPITECANIIVSEAQRLIIERNDEIYSLEIEIDPMLSVEPQTKLSHLLDTIVTDAKCLASAHPFLAPVNPKIVRDYHLYVQKPIDLETIRVNCVNHVYSSCDAFLNDIDLLYNNCVLYNGQQHLYSKMAQEVRDHMYTMIQKQGQVISEIEKQIGSIHIDDNNGSLEHDPTILQDISQSQQLSSSQESQISQQEEEIIEQLVDNQLSEEQIIEDLNLSPDNILKKLNIDFD